MGKLIFDMDDITELQERLDKRLEEVKKSFKKYDGDLSYGHGIFAGLSQAKTSVSLEITEWTRGVPFVSRVGPE